MTRGRGGSGAEVYVNQISAWLTDEITAAQKNMDYYYKKQDWENFKLWRNKTKSLIRAAKKAFFENAMNENRDNSFLWKQVKDITGHSQQINCPQLYSLTKGR